MKKISRNDSRKKVKIRINKKIRGTKERPRLAFFRSLKYLYAQVIDDSEGRTLVSASSIEKELRTKYSANKDAAKVVGELVAERLMEKGMKSVVFDRSGYRYHGVVKVFADAARAKGLEF